MKTRVGGSLQGKAAPLALRLIHVEPGPGLVWALATWAGHEHQLALDRDVPTCALEIEDSSVACGLGQGLSS